MLDKTMTVKCDKAGPAFDSIDVGTMVEIECCLAIFLGMATRRSMLF